MTHLRAVKVDGSGEVTDAYAKLAHDHQLLIEDHAQTLREKSALKAQLTKLHKVAPDAETVAGLLAYWRVKLRGPNSRVDVSLDSKRADAVRRTLRRLGEMDDVDGPERIRAAIDGCARYPFEGRYGQRFPEPATGLKRKDELLYILRDEVKLEQFAALHEHDAARIAYAHDLKRRLDTQPNLRAVLASFDPRYAEILCRAIRWCQSDAI